jgi:uncharacterized membrane protein
LDDLAIYEDEVRELKLGNQKGRILYSLKVILFELLVLVLLLQFLGPGAVIGFVFTLVAFLPTPYFTVPETYRIVEGAVIFDGGKVLRLKRGQRLRLDMDGKYVSLLHPRKGEFLRLYAHEPEKVYKILRV